MAEEKKEPWLNHLALMTVILAVCATLSTFKGGGYSTRSVITQAQASDQWAYYQAKSTKQNLYEVQLSQLQLQSLTLPNDAEVKAAYAKKVADYQAKIATYTDERKTIQADAKKLEAERDDAQKHGKPFGFAVIFLQVSILLNSIAGLMKVKRVWHLSLPVGLAGVVFFANGFFLFF
ncbi:DUF4337 domain-containing protein [Chitinimonas sp.]|uniref:DUF4337 domain-containing protein n=1 Tax=Chitinimonas sp. TaxID=1934313 RepID=UPI002F91F398